MMHKTTSARTVGLRFLIPGLVLSALVLCGKPFGLLVGIATFCVGFGLIMLAISVVAPNAHTPREQ